MATLEPGKDLLPPHSACRRSWPSTILMSDFDIMPFQRRPASVGEPSSDVQRGTLDLLLLKTLALEPMHGWGISQRIQQLSGDVLQVGQGSLYPALKRIEQRGWIDGRWQETPDGRRARYYRLTGAGRRALGREAAAWRHYVRIVEGILGARGPVGDSG